MPASMTINAPAGIPSPASMDASVPGSATLLAKVCERRTKPLPWSARPSVTSRQSLRSFFEIGVA